MSIDELFQSWFENNWREHRHGELMLRSLDVEEDGWCSSREHDNILYNLSPRLTIRLTSRQNTSTVTENGRCVIDIATHSMNQQFAVVRTAVV